MKTATQVRQFQGVVGEIIPAPVTGYDPMTERALDDIGAILRREREMTVGQAKALYCRVRHDAQIQAQVVTMESRRAIRMERVDNLKAKVEAGVYQVNGEEIALRALTYPEFRDYERRADYAAQQSGVEEGGAFCEADYAVYRSFWRTLWGAVVVLAGILLGVAWLLLAITPRR